MEKTSPITILIADDHPVVREGLTALLNRREDMRVVAEASTGREAVAQFLLHRPQVTLVDLRMPEMDGVDAITAIREQVPSARLIVLTTYDDDEDIHRALRAGAKAYMLKDSPRAELAACIRAGHGGRTVVGPAIAAKLADRVGAATLTHRELEVPRSRRRRQLQQTDCSSPVHCRGHRQEPPHHNPRQARRGGSHAGSNHRPQARAPAAGVAARCPSDPPPRVPLTATGLRGVTAALCRTPARRTGDAAAEPWDLVTPGGAGPGPPFDRPRTCRIDRAKDPSEGRGADPPMATILLTSCIAVGPEATPAGPHRHHAQRK